MLKIFTRTIIGMILIILPGQNAFAQIAVSGTVLDNVTKETLPGVTVSVKGRAAGSSTNENGRFAFTVTQAPPFTLVVSNIGYKTIELDITGSTTNLVIELETQAILGQEVVVAASRTPERILESPVSIERVNATSIREAATPTFYDALINLKGVEMSAQSLTFKSVNTRGFNSNGNTRFNQYVDGMDNQAPGLNFSVGNIIGMSDLDADNVELLPGASSALYGAGGINGTMLMTSKNPFTYQGLSYQFKTGINHANDPLQSSRPFEEAGLRYAKAWNKFAFKTNISYFQAKDWQAGNYTNFDRPARLVKPGDRSSDPNYDGINIYGDEVSQNMRNVANSVVYAGTSGFVKVALGLPGTTVPSQAQIDAFKSNPAGLAALNGFLSTNPQTRPFFLGLRAGLIPNQAVSRTGYAENDLVDYDTKSFKTSNSIHYKINNNIEAIGQANWGSGTSVYTGTDRYSLRNFSIGQYKLELKGRDFILRGYTTQERSGDSYISSILGSYINEKSKASKVWFPQYIGNYVGARAAGASDAVAHSTARTAADQGRFVAGTPQYEITKNTIMNTTISSGLGAKFDDKSNLWHYEGMYNFTSLFHDAVAFQAGASYRIFDLNSGGTIFDDLNRKIDIKEYGAFGQLGKQVFNDKLKLTLSGRYDKSSNFSGRFTPRITGVYTVLPNNNIRLSYQTGYRNPTTQNQYIDLSVGGGVTRLIGGLPALLTKYNLYANKAFTDVSYRAFLGSIAASPAGTGNPALLQTYTFNAGGVRPESVKAWELGYKGLLGSNILIDAYGYYNQYEDFITGVEVYQNSAPGSFTKFGVPVNAAGKVSSHGAALGLDYMINAFNISGNVSYNKIGDIPSTYINDYNTPKIRFNLGLGNREIAKNVGFNVTYRWQDKFYWTSSFASGNVPAFGTVDAQANLKLPAVKSMLKIGGSNLFNKYYITSYGNPQIGGMYYVSLLFDQFLR